METVLEFNLVTQALTESWRPEVLRLFMSLNQRFTKFNTHMNQLGILLKVHFLIQQV